MFTGTYTPKMDDKGRITLPAKYREQLAGGVAITNGQDHSLTVYPQAAFQAIAEQLVEAEWTDENSRAYMREMFASTDEQLPDAQGRVTLTSLHRTHSGLTKDCIVSGAGRFLEIWNPERWSLYRETSSELFANPTFNPLRPRSQPS